MPFNRNGTITLLFERQNRNFPYLCNDATSIISVWRNGTFEAVSISFQNLLRTTITFSFLLSLHR